MKNGLSSYENAGTIFRVLGWLQLLGAGILLPWFYISVYLKGGGFTSWSDFIVPPLITAFIAGIAAFMLTLGTAIKDHKTWGRAVGMVIAVIQLIGFPIGTLIGAYILWCLIAGWAIPAADAPAASDAPSA